MHATVRMTLVLALAMASGCLAIADPGQYHHDLGCDFRMDLTGMSAHTTQETHFYVNTPSAFTLDGVSLTSHVLLDPTPSANFSIRLPEGVASHQSVVDFYSDVNGNHLYDHAFSQTTNPGGDHTWVRSGLCASAPLAFAHVFQFDDFDVPSGRPNAATVHFVGFPASAGPVEVRIFDETSPTPAATRGLYRRNDTGTGSFDVVLAGIVDGNSDLNLEVEVWIDVNGNRVVDPGTDIAFTKSALSSELGSSGVTLTHPVTPSDSVRGYGGVGPYVTINP